MSVGGEPQPVLFVIDHFRSPHAGTEGQLFHLVKGLDRTRFRPLLLVFRESDYLREHGFPCEYRVLNHTRMLSPATWLALWKVARAYRAAGVSLAHIFFNDPSVVCPPIFRACGIWSIISRRDMGYWYTRAYRAMLACSGRFVSAVIANSDAVRQVTVASEPFNESQVHVVYNGYPSMGGNGETGNDQNAPSIPEDLAELRAAHPDVVFAGLVANIRPIKRIEDAVRAVAKVGEKSKLHLVIIGDGDQQPLRALAGELGIAGRVHFLGPRSDVKACLLALDMALLCSESEGFSNAIVEYMQAGLPVVCSAVGGNPEAVQQGETGYLYPCGDVGHLARHLQVLCDDDELRRHIGDNARSSARQRFSMEAMVAQHQTIYDDLLGAAYGSGEIG